MRELLLNTYFWFLFACLAAFWGLLVAGCESTTQTAIRENEPPAVAFIIAAQRGQNIQPAPATVFYGQ